MNQDCNQYSDIEDSLKLSSDDDDSSESIIDSSSNVLCNKDSSQDNSSPTISTRLRDRSLLHKKILFSPILSKSALNKTCPARC